MEQHKSYMCFIFEIYVMLSFLHFYFESTKISLFICTDFQVTPWPHLHRTESRAIQFSDARTEHWMPLWPEFWFRTMFICAGFLGKVVYILWADLRPVHFLLCASESMNLTDFQTRDLICGSERHSFKLFYHIKILITLNLDNTKIFRMRILYLIDSLKLPLGKDRTTNSASRSSSACRNVPSLATQHTNSLFMPRKA